jgi:hypothetical protein
MGNCGQVAVTRDGFRPKAQLMALALDDSGVCGQNKRGNSGSSGKVGLGYTCKAKVLFHWHPKIRV